MKESNLMEEEKSMYAICLSVLAICFIALLFINSPGQFNLTGAVGAIGAVVYEQKTVQNITIKYENLSDNNSTNNVTQETALNAILQAEGDMQEMAEQDFGVKWVNDTLIEAKNLLLAAQSKIGVEVYYKKVLEKTRVIYERKKQAFEISDLIRASQLRTDEFKQQNLDTSKVESIINYSISEFKNERYENAENLLASIDKKLIDLSGETTLAKIVYRDGKEGIINFIKKNYKVIFLLLGSLLVIAILLYNRIMISILRRRISNMKVEKLVLEDLMKKAQKDYFAEGDTTKQTFEIKMSNYKKRLVEINGNLPLIEALLEKRLKLKRVI